MDRHDVAVIGAGIVGVAAARALLDRRPDLDVVVLDKESDVGTHQTGHNSGVVHSGLYYRPGTLKARLCVAGRRRLLDFCDQAGVPVGRHGKIVTATRADQLPALEELHRRARANGLTGVERLGAGGIRDHEPHATGVAALWVPETSVVDYGLVARELARPLELVTDFLVDSIRTDTDGFTITAGERAVRATRLVNCAGLQSDRVAALAGVQADLRIIPFRGEYFALREAATHLVAGMIYPVPDPRFPFLGVHFTRRIDDSVEVGPNAVLALGREHYRGTRPSPRDLAATIGWPGFWRIVGRYWRTGTEELWHSAWPSSYARTAQALVPDLGPEDLIRAGAGVRAQAVARDGELLDDFAVVEHGRAVHVLNAPSPAATSSLAIGDHIAQRVLA